jgi:hypothetical protein
MLYLDVSTGAQKSVIRRRMTLQDGIGARGVREGVGEGGPFAAQGKQAPRLQRGLVNVVAGFAEHDVILALFAKRRGEA